jgi:hypothetical protein
MPKKEITITEIEEFEPSRVDGVGKGANGFPILMLKSIDAETDSVASVTKADDMREDCKTCEGDGKILGNNRKCPDCMGSGKAPKIGESMKQYMEFVSKDVPGSAPSGSGATPAKFCPTCGGDGFLGNSIGEGADARGVGEATDQCPDCGGTGLDQATTNPQELNAVAADAGTISVGDPMGRERIDKADAGAECAGCKAMNAADAEYCAKCGGAMMMKTGMETNECPGCVTAAKNGESVCATCGAKVEKADAPKGFDPKVGGGVYREDVPDEDHAGKNRSFPIVTPGDVSDAASSLGRAGKDNYSIDKIKANIIAIARRKGPKFVAQLPQNWQEESADLVGASAKSVDESDAMSALHDKAHEDWHRSIGQEPCTSKADCKAKQAEYEASKAVTVSLDGTAIMGDNPMSNAVEMPMPAHDLDNDPDGDLPGGPAWEAVDAATATSAALALMHAAELIRTFAQREAIEVAAGEGNDIFDANAAEMAMIGVTGALGIMAQLAFHEGLEAQKSLEDEDVAKAGKRLSGKSIAALATARDHLNMILGDDDPAKQKDGDSNDDDTAVGKYIDSADKALLSKEIEDMSIEELEKVLDQRDERLVGLIAETLKSNGKKAKKGKDEDADAKVAEDLDDAADAIEDAQEAQMEDMDGEDDDDAMKASVACPECDMMNKANAMTCKGCGYAMKSADADLTEEQIEARNAAKEAKRALKAARRAEKEAAENAAVQKAIAEGVAEATKAVQTLKERLATVEKMAAPSSIVRTAPQDAVIKSVERDSLELRLAATERIARETPDHDIRKAKREEAEEIRAAIAALRA